MLKSLLRKPWVQAAIAAIAAFYMRLVRSTARIICHPNDLYQQVEPAMPIIMAMWHGEHLTSPLMVLPHHKIKVLISHHRDGEINARTIKLLGIDVIRGSGSHGQAALHKRGAGAMRDMLRALENGWNVASTADVPKVAKKAGRGIVLLAKLSGRPIYPVMAVAKSRLAFPRAWDHAKVPLPFSRVALVLGQPISVAVDADDGQLEHARQTVETALNAAMAQAYAMVESNQPLRPK